MYAKRKNFVAVVFVATVSVLLH